MKFVVNRVGADSIWTESELRNREVSVDEHLSCEYYGWLSGNLIDGNHCGWFTIAEVPDTEEGYYLL